MSGPPERERLSVVDVFGGVQHSVFMRLAQVQAEIETAKCKGGQGAATFKEEALSSAMSLGASLFYSVLIYIHLHPSLVAMVRGVSSDTVSEILRSVSLRQ